MASREYSKRLGPISDDQLQAALDRFGFGRLLSARPADGGLFGQNIMLTSTEGEFVFRGAPHWDPAGNDDWQFQKEQRFSRIVHDASTGPPVPWPYLLEESREIFGWHWAMTPRLPGDSAERRYGGNRRAFANPAFARAAGEALALLHSIPVRGAGTYQREAQGIVASTESLSEHISGQIRLLLAQSLSLGAATTAADVEWVERVLIETADALGMDCRASIVHLDYSAGNIVGLRHGEHFEVTGIVDWMTAEIGHPEADLVRLLSLALEAPERARAFIESYNAVRPLVDGWRDRFPVFMLLDRLIFWVYGQRNGGWFSPDQTLRSWAEPYMTLHLPPVA